MESNQVLHFDRFTLDRARGRLQADGVDVELRPKSFEVLRQLIENAGRLVSKDELARAVWPNVVTDDSLVQCIHDVRRVLGDEDQRFIKTVPRRGYMFVANVDADLGTATLPLARRDRRRPGAVGLALALVMVTALAVWAAFTWQTGRSSPQGQGLTIAVLPFATLGPSDHRQILTLSRPLSSSA